MDKRSGGSGDERRGGRRRYVPYKYRSHKYRPDGHKSHGHKSHGHKSHQHGHATKKNHKVAIIITVLVSISLFSAVLVYDNDIIMKLVNYNVNEDIDEKVPLEKNVIADDTDAQKNTLDDADLLSNTHTASEHADDITVEPADTQKINPAEIIAQRTNTESQIKSINSDRSADDLTSDLKLYMLELVNDERTFLGLEPVKLGKNKAAQYHANSMLDNCVTGHWGVDGLKPYMRYALAGGHQHNAENVQGLSYCIKASENYMRISPRSHVQESVQSFMTSPGHRDNILDPHHKFLNIGLAWNDYNMMIVQHFEYDYVLFSQKPSINDGILSFSLDTKNDIRVSSDTSILVTYDPPPRNLTQGQIANTYCYDHGLSVATILSPPDPGSRYLDTTYQELVSFDCPDPYRIFHGIPAPKSVDEAHAAHTQAKHASENPAIALKRTIPFVVAEEWNQSSEHLDVTANISHILLEHGPGVYTITVWGFAHGDVTLTNYPIFYGITLPTLDLP